MIQKYHSWAYIRTKLWKLKSLSRARLFATPGLHSPWNSPGQNTGVGSLSLLQGIFLTQGSNPGLLNCKRILYQLSHQGSPRTLDWVRWPGGSQNNSRWSSRYIHKLLSYIYSFKLYFYSPWGCKERDRTALSWRSINSSGAFSSPSGETCTHWQPLPIPSSLSPGQPSVYFLSLSICSFGHCW